MFAFERVSEKIGWYWKILQPVYETVIDKKYHLVKLCGENGHSLRLPWFICKNRCFVIGKYVSTVETCL